MRGSVFHPGRLKRKKGGAAAYVDARYDAKATGSAHDDTEILVSELEGPFRRCSLKLNEVARVLVAAAAR
jgi:hypothetical protein